MAQKIPPELQAQLDEQKKQCVFCKILSGEVQSNKVYEDHSLLGVLDINPASKGHTLLMPKEHAPVLQFLDQKIVDHLFGILPNIIGAIKKSFLYTGAAVFIASGGVAGQQVPHVVAHLIGREKRDGLSCFELSKKRDIDPQKAAQAAQLISQHMPSVLQQAGIKPGKAIRPESLAKMAALYEDDKILIAQASSPQSAGHLEIYALSEAKDFEKVNAETARHLLTAAASCGSLLFQGLGAQGTNIIVKSGVSDDNKDSLVVHVIARWENDGLDLQWEPSKEKGDLTEVASRLCDATFVIEHSQKKKEPLKVIDLSTPRPTIVVKEPKHKADEIEDAIKALRKSAGK